VTKRKPVYGYRRVPYTTWERYWKEKWVSKQVFDGYRYVRREEPVYDYQLVPSGQYRTETYTDTEPRWGQVGTTVKWELKKDPEPVSTADIWKFKEEQFNDLDESSKDTTDDPVTSNILLSTPEPDDPDEPNPDGDDPDSIWWKLWEAGIDLTAKAADYLSKNPINIGPVTLPVFIPKGFGLEDEGAVVLYKALEEVDPWKLRALGRGIDEVLTPLAWPVGWGLTVAPEQIQNIKEDAPTYEIEADLEVDTLGFVLAELTGDAAFLATIPVTGIGSIAIGGAVDIGVGAVYDWAVDEFGIRDAVIAQNKWEEENKLDPVPRPTAPDSNAESTATPSPGEETPTETPEPPQSTPEPSLHPQPGS
jgi:hypothetical protein